MFLASEFRRTKYISRMLTLFGFIGFFADDSCETKITDFDDIVVRHQNVTRCEISMYVFLLFYVAHTVGHLEIINKRWKPSRLLRANFSKMEPVTIKQLEKQWDRLEIGRENKCLSMVSAFKVSGG